MGQVVVTIAGRVYRMACEDGQEDHLERLARDLDAKMAQLREGFGEIGEQRLAIMTALTVVDELAETQARLARAERAAEVARAEVEAARAGDSAVQTQVATALAAAAERIEKVARDLNTKI